MRAAYIIPGSGSSFYCGNCMRDALYVSSLRRYENIEVMAIPLYLPLIEYIAENQRENDVFFGAVSLYLKEKIPALKTMPAFVDKLMDSRPLLNFAAKQAGTTSPDGLEQMTLNMIRTENPSRGKEINRLADYIREKGGADVVHVSNALIMGLATQLKKALDRPIICSLQNEDDWIDEMKEPYRKQAWGLIAEEERHIDHFVSSSQYFKDLIIARTGIDEKRISVVPPAVETSPLHKTRMNSSDLAIGFFARLNKNNGLDKLIDAFVILKKRNSHPGLKLHVSGGYTKDDKQFHDLQIAKITEENLTNDVIFHPGFTGTHKQNFFESIDLLSVPVRKHDAFGLYLLEAISSGVPVVQPHTGAFPEIIKATEGGITYTPDTVEQLVASLDEMLHDQDKLRRTGLKGRETMSRNFSPQATASSLMKVYEKVV